MKDTAVFIFYNDLSELDQCMESVRLQTYDPVSGIVKAEYRPDGKVMINASDITALKTRFVFFCEGGSIISPDALEDLKKTAADKKAKASGACVMVREGDRYLNAGYCPETVFGKLFLTEALKEILIKADDSLTPQELSTLFLAENDYAESPSAAVYDRKKIFGKKCCRYSENSADRKRSGGRSRYRQNGSTVGADHESDIIAKYRSGKAGLKTLVMSLAEWGRYKLKNKILRF